jgi:NADPH:quinone reductase-like Zn-dependent oxidoreductase
MRAFVNTSWGGPEALSLQQVDEPPITDEGVRVRLRATSINAFDWHMLRGKPYFARLGGGFRRPKDTILGLDVAGVVEEIGPRVTHVKPGDRVFGSRLGAFAEVVVGKNMVPMPPALSFEAAAAVPTAGQTALQGLREHGELKAGERVLINGAGGGVGTFAVQIAKAMGAEVVATTGPRSVEKIRSIGADGVLDYTRDDFTRNRGSYDLILDVGGTKSLAAMRRALTPAGRVVMVAPQPGQWIGPIARIVGAMATNKLGARPVRGFLAGVDRTYLTALGEMIEAGTVTPVIDRTFPFEQIPDAVRYVETGHPTGKVVITF